jgi:tetratricopeptide (TPR) repeat protein
MLEKLLALAIEDPDRARLQAEQILAQTTEPLERSYAHQALGIVLRDAGRTAEALQSLRDGIREARSSGRNDRERDVRASFGASLVAAGRTRDGLDQLDRALSGVEGEIAASIRMRRAGALALLGQYREAAPDVRAALREMVAAGNRSWEGRTRIWLSHIELNLGNLDAAEREAADAETAFNDAGAIQEHIDAIEALAEIAVARGDIARGLRVFKQALEDRRVTGQPPRFPFINSYASCLLAAGLASDAIALIKGYARTATIPEASLAELHLLLATAMLAAGEPSTAAGAAATARRMFREQRRPWYELRARLVALRAAGPAARVSEARKVADALDAERADEAPEALILTGRAMRGDARRAQWSRATPYRHHPNGLVRSSAYLAGALEREECGDRGGVLRSCSAGLDATDEHRRLMGSSELRALATTHGRELTEIALRYAAHDPRTLLRWSERTRATALAQPPATSDAKTIPASLAALRDNGRRLAEARQAGEPTEDLEKERLRLERAVRTESHTQSAADTDPQRPASAEEVVAGVGDGCIVELVDVDGTLHVLVVHNGRVRRKVAGTTKEVADLLGPTAMLLRRASRGRPANTADIGRRLQEAILGDAARLIPDGPVVLAPTARLHGLAWSLLPTLNDRPFSIVPSAGQWLRATRTARPRKRRTVLVAGPDLQSGGAEVPLLAKLRPDATLLDGKKATLAAVLDQLDGADLAHLATHGRFRADSPLFSSLDLADGPLTVHDLERLKRAPYRVVLSACESGVLAPVGAEELLGLAAALFSIGSAGLVSSVAEVNDAATATLMVGLHDALAKGADPAAALHRVRQSAAGDPVAAGTAAAFVALGV